MKHALLCVCIVLGSIVLSHAIGYAFGTGVTRGAINTLISERGAK
jgi:hypothetical protein